MFARLDLLDRKGGESMLSGMLGAAVGMVVGVFVGAAAVVLDESE